MRLILAPEFLRPKKENLILEDGPAQRVAEILLVIKSLGRARLIEIIVRVEELVAQELECLAVEFVGPGFRDGLNRSRAIAAILRAVG